MKQLTPFHDKEGKLHWPYRALQSIAFVFPTPPPVVLNEGGTLELLIPEDQREKHQDGTGVILSVGPGYFDKKNRWIPTDSRLKPGTKVYFDNTVPWDLYVYGQDLRKYRVVVCPEADILGVVEE